MFPQDAVRQAHQESHLLANRPCANLEGSSHGRRTQSLSVRDCREEAPVIPEEPESVESTAVRSRPWFGKVEPARKGP